MNADERSALLRVFDHWTLAAGIDLRPSVIHLAIRDLRHTHHWR